VSEAAVPEQQQLFAVANPCVGVCTSSRSGYCKGCLRSRQERFYWNDLNQAQRRMVLELCSLRRQRIKKRRHYDTTSLVQDDLFADHFEQADLF